MKMRQAIAFVLRFSALGDVAMTVPVVYAVVRSNPAVQFRYYTHSRLKEMFADPPRNLEIIGLENIHAGNVWRFLRKEIRTYNPAYLADLHNVSRTWGVDLYAVCRGMKVMMVEKKRLSRRYCLKNRIPQRNYAERYNDVFKRLGLNAGRLDSGPTAGRMRSPVELRHPAVGIAPFARYATKTYPFEMMEKVVKELSGRNVSVYLFGGGEREKRMLDRLAGMFRNCHSLVGRYSLSEEMGIMAGLDLMLSMDSANQHICSLTGTKVLTVWGGTTPLCGFAPFGQSEGNALIADVRCQPCSIAGTRGCGKGSMECMTSIPPLRIAERVMAELGNENDGQ